MDGDALRNEEQWLIYGYGQFGPRPTDPSPRFIDECWESVRSICESGPASSFDECVAERSMRLCGRQPSPRPGPVGPVAR